VFNRFDADKSGGIVYEEFIKMFAIKGANNGVH